MDYPPLCAYHHLAMGTVTKKLFTGSLNLSESYGFMALDYVAYMRL